MAEHEVIFVRVWRFRVEPAAREAFQHEYGPEGAWARLFARQEGYLGTELFGSSDGSGTYVTIDRWRDAKDWHLFLETHRDAYAELDAQCEGLTVAEENLGSYFSCA